MSESGIQRLRAGLVEVIVDTRGRGLPRIVHWGRDLGELTDGELERIVMSNEHQVTSYVLDEPVPVAVLPEHALGYAGLAGIRGSRDDGSDWSPLFTVSDVMREDTDGTERLIVDADDRKADLAVRLEFEIVPSGLIRVRATLRNTDAERIYRLEGLTPTLPVPPEAAELLDLCGRHTRERSPQRQPFHVGTRLRDSRRGHGGHDMSLLLVAGTPHFGFRSGEVWGVHVGWSGNYRAYAERLPTGASAVLGGGEELLPGEVRLSPGESYESPWLYGSWAADGMDGMSARFHQYLRARPQHPTPARPRPSLINTWEAVYFDADLDTLVHLAERAAAIGIERFVLDDGWFKGRRGENAGLGDWYVDQTVWPDGLRPLVDRVRELGMEFGLWFEPESVNPDSDLAREHPEWLFSAGDRLPPESRLQQCLDLGHEGAWNYLLERIDSLVGEYRVDYIKWDMNRDIVDGGHGPSGEPGIRRNTLALYALLDELKARHPGLEIESCAGGGGRIDLGVLERTDRVWASDTNDALERQMIQRWTGLLVPPELVGAHIGAQHSHSTGRTHSMAFRGGTALFGHFGVELDLTKVPQEETDGLAEWLDLYKRMRPLLHSGTVVRSDRPDPSLWLHGVVAQDRSEAIFAWVGMATPVTQPPGRIRFPGLDPDRDYLLRLLKPGHKPTQTRQLPPWVAGADPDGPGLLFSGSTLLETGIQATHMFPETLVLMHLVAQ